ncbi:transcriptional repressor [Streptomyces sp. NBC_01476]
MGEVARVIGRPTRQRAAVVRALAEGGGFTSAQALHAGLRADGRRVGLNTVYRTLTALAAAGRADVVHEPSGERLFRFRHSPGHQHYLVCRQCGLSLLLDTAPVERWADQVAAGTGFAEVTHTLELSGVCADCLAR